MIVRENKGTETERSTYDSDLSALIFSINCSIYLTPILYCQRLLICEGMVLNIDGTKTVWPPFADLSMNSANIESAKLICMASHSQCVKEFCYV